MGSFMKIWALLLLFLCVQGQCDDLAMDEQLNITLVNVYAEQPIECRVAPLATADISFGEFASVFINAELKQ